MNTHGLPLELLNKRIIRTAELNALGFTNSMIRRFVRSGQLSRLRHGYYETASSNDVREHEILKKILPEGVLFLETAIFYYGYSDYTPRCYHLAVPRDISRSRLKVNGIDIKPHFTSHYALGVDTMLIHNVKMLIYNRERTICDCVHYRNRMDSELFYKALNGYAIDPKKDLLRLSDYARRLHVYNKVMDYMGVLIND